MAQILNVAGLNKTEPGWKNDPSKAYIGRSGGSFHFGNPFTHRRGTLAAVVLSSRDEACDAFAAWLAEEDKTIVDVDGKEHRLLDIEPGRRAWILENLSSLRGRDLVCWCAPQRCHASTYLEILETIP